MRASPIPTAASRASTRATPRRPVTAAPLPTHHCRPMAARIPELASSTDVKKRTHARISGKNRGGAPLAWRSRVRARWVVGFWVAVVVGCGARTELYVPLHRDAEPDVVVHHEAGVDVVEEDAPEF